MFCLWLGINLSILHVPNVKVDLLPECELILCPCRIMKQVKLFLYVFLAFPIILPPLCSSKVAKRNTSGYGDHVTMTALKWWADILQPCIGSSIWDQFRTHGKAYFPWFSWQIMQEISIGKVSKNAARVFLWLFYMGKRGIKTSGWAVILLPPSYPPKC